MKTTLLLLFAAGVMHAAEVGPVPGSVRREFKLAPFYQNHTEAGGLPVVGSTNVSDFALREAAWIVGQMLTNRPDILRAMVTNKTRLAVMAWNEFTTDGQKLVPPIRIQRAVRQN